MGIDGTSSTKKDGAESSENPPDGPVTGGMNAVAERLMGLDKPEEEDGSLKYQDWRPTTVLGLDKSGFANKFFMMAAD
jgi:hypothetical protein